MKTQIKIIFPAVIMVLMAHVNFGQAPNLQTAVNFAIFTAAGAVENGTATTVRGDVGTTAGAFNAFPPGTLIGQKHVADPVAVQAGIDVASAYGDLASRTCGSVHGVGLGNGETLGPNVYCLGAASTLNGILTLDGGGDPNAVFIFQINGAFATNALSQVVLIRSASICNTFWQVNGQVDLGAGSVFEGTIIAGGAINLLAGATLQGRALSTAGAISMYDNNITLSSTCSTIPTLSEWGLIIFGLLLLGGGVIYIIRRKQAAVRI